MPIHPSLPAGDSAELPAWFGDDTANDAPRTKARLPHSSLSGLSVYQDVVLAGTTVRTGVRDCRERWGLLEAHLPHSGAVLDVGSNFGWFPLEICRAFPECVVASVEADERSASVQREVLESHQLNRVCLLTERAGTAMAERFARSGQRFGAALCLSVLHWIPDHETFLAALGAITEQLFIEHPDPREAGAGSAWIRAEIGPIGPYLEKLFPDRECACLGRTTSHLDSEIPREIWRVGPERSAQQSLERQQASESLAVEALADLSPAWPARDWWLSNFSDPGDAQLRLTPAGLSVVNGVSATIPASQLRRKLAQIPQEGIASRRAWWYRRLRRAAGDVLRAVGMRRAA